eukprot:Rmarinus@m.29795
MNDRFTFLQSLVTEFQETKDDTKKEHILAHLANFAYDAENFEYLRRLNIVELFIDFLTEDASFQSLAIGGICNCCNDPLNALVIKEAEGLQDICECLKSENAEVVVNALTALYYLCGTIPADVMKVVSSVDLSSLCSSRNPCISNMANLLCNEAKGIKPPRPRP